MGPTRTPLPPLTAPPDDRHGRAAAGPGALPGQDVLQDGQPYGQQRAVHRHPVGGGPAGGQPGRVEVAGDAVKPWRQAAAHGSQVAPAKLFRFTARAQRRPPACALGIGTGGGRSRSCTSLARQLRVWFPCRVAGVRHGVELRAAPGHRLPGARRGSWGHGCRGSWGHGGSEEGVQERRWRAGSDQGDGGFSTLWQASALVRGHGNLGAGEMFGGSPRSWSKGLARVSCHRWQGKPAQGYCCRWHDGLVGSSGGFVPAMAAW